jgi:hypothetical protein
LLDHRGAGFEADWAIDGGSLPSVHHVIVIRVGNFSSRLGRFTGLTLLLTIVFAPLVVYPFWLHFQNYSCPMWALLLPIPFPIIAGIGDYKLSAFQCAALLARGAYTISVWQ